MTILCLSLFIVCLFDYSRLKIPNLLLVGMWAAGLALGFRGGGGTEVIAFFTKSLVIMAVLYPFFRIGTLGAGDVKLLGVCAGYFSGSKILLFLFFSMLFSAIFSLLKLWKEKNAKERFQYLGEYVADVLRTGKLHLYFENKKAFRMAGICLSGPVLISALMHWGGIY